MTRVLGSNNVSDKEAARKQHSRDEGVERRDHLVDLVVWPKNTEEVSAVASLCYEKHVPMIPFGTGTGLESGVCAVYVYKQCVFILISFMNHKKVFLLII